jgi:hypothetical protein
VGLLHLFERDVRQFAAKGAWATHATTESLPPVSRSAWRTQPLDLFPDPATVDCLA